jgi:hypothetical protein
MDFELAMRNLLGDYYSHSADLFCDTKYSKNILGKQFQKFKKE